MKLTARSTDEKIECFYNSCTNKENFILKVDGKELKISRFDLNILISTLHKFDEMMTITVRR